MYLTIGILQTSIAQPKASQHQIAQDVFDAIPEWYGKSSQIKYYHLMFVMRQHKNDGNYNRSETEGEQHGEDPDSKPEPKTLSKCFIQRILTLHKLYHQSSKIAPQEPYYTEWSPSCADTNASPSSWPPMRWPPSIIAPVISSSHTSQFVVHQHNGNARKRQKIIADATNATGALLLKWRFMRSRKLRS